jgi:uncharacterized cupredoxin-like copper-binding protein
VVVKKISVFALIFSIILSACGGSGGSGAPAASISIEMTEFTFNPKEITVFSGRETTLDLKNSGAVEHKFTILKKGVVAQAPFDPEKQAGDILAEFTLNAGKSEIVKFTLPEPGGYAFICNIPGHMEAGMAGKLTAVQP